MLILKLVKYICVVADKNRPLTRPSLIVIVALGFVTLSSCGQSDNLDLNKIKWTSIDKTFSCYFDKQSNQALQIGDSIHFKGVGELEKKTIVHKAYLDTLEFTLKRGDTIIIPQFKTFTNILTRNSIVFLKVDLTTIYTSLIQQNNKVTLYLQDSIDSTAVTIFIEELNKKEFVSSTNFTSKEKAAEKYKKEVGEDFVSFIGHNPLPSSIELKINPHFINSKDLEKIKEEFQSDKRVKDITHSNITEFEKYRNKIIIFKLTTSKINP